MKGIERISQRLMADAEAEIAALKAETAEKREAILAEYRQKAQEVYENRMQEGTEACESRIQRIGSAAEAEARKSVLAFKQEMVTEVFTKAVKMITELPEDQYVSFLTSLVVRAANSGTEELVFNKKDAAAVGKKVASAANALLKEKGKVGGLTVSAETKEIPGGVIVRQGNIEVNCAVDTLVQMSRSELASQVAEILFA